jgi:hypothetical protein
MQTLLDDQFAPITSRVGFIELRLEAATAALVEWRHDLERDVTVSDLEGPFPSLLGTLEPLVIGGHPRELLVASASTRWTAYFDCGFPVGDPVSVIGYLARRESCQGLACASIPQTIGTGFESPGRYGAVQFELFGPLPTQFLNYVRTISVAHDGGSWRFDANGTVQDFEDESAYGARRIHDRFTSSMLSSYCKALDIDIFDPDYYGPKGRLVESRMESIADLDSLTLAEAQKRLGIAPGIASRIPG